MIVCDQSVSKVQYLKQQQQESEEEEEEEGEKEEKEEKKESEKEKEEKEEPFAKARALMTQPFFQYVYCERESN